MGSVLIRNKSGGSIGVSTTLLAISSIPAYDNLEVKSPIFVICAVIVLITLFVLSYIFFVLWNFSIIHFFFKNELLYIGQETFRGIFLEFRNLEDVKKELQRSLSEAQDVLETEALKCMIAYMGMIE